MGINHGGRHVFMAKEFLHGADVRAGFEQVSRKAVPESMRSSGLADVRTLGAQFHRPLQQSFVDMVAANDARTRVGRDVVGWKHVLPAPFAGGTGVLAFERMRKPNAAEPISE